MTIQNHFATNADKVSPLNKGHYCLDTKTRIDRFYQLIADRYQNPDLYQSYRSQWNDPLTTFDERNYPLHVDLELVSTCNLNCEMCYTISDEFKSKVVKGFMDKNLAFKIIDEISGHVFSLRLSFRGESTLHKNLFEIIEYAKKSGIKEVSFLTNATRLDLSFYQKLSSAGLDWLTCSIDGTGETYERIRYPTKFTTLISNLRSIADYRITSNYLYPLVKVQGILPAIEESGASKYYNIFEPISDLIAFNPLIDFFNHPSEDNLMETFMCFQPFQRLVVGSDGFCMMCANDEKGHQIIGDANTSSIRDIWKSPMLQDNRDKLLNNKYRDISSCKECYFPRKLKPERIFKVNDREVACQDYL